MKSPEDGIVSNFWNVGKLLLLDCVTLH